ncbi:hypothetical protein DVR12_16685 [Chitinophaga silvatica]|uniref:Tetratricopeptide repeat protein n=1 Tax=Chitinophaga silvatica TaxID=2282649 RepID=A0A3E1Y7G9_9BACT|nr:hypothetical protein [Chitinophaga silvatica]RFS20986.1 hypothetical protein DVR12_16685 [Chitinophaga silvatica]
MNFRKLFRFLISCIVLLLGNVVYTLCCGPTPDPYDYYISFFSPLTKGAGYEPFYYTALDNFYANPTPSEEVANTNDWQKYTGSKVKTKDIRECIYTYPLSNLQAINTGAGLPDSLKQNSFVGYLLKDKEASRYLLFAKSCEPEVSVENAWTAPERNAVQLTKLYEEGINLYHQTKNENIRERYAFQLVRLLHYNNQYHKAEISFDQLFKNNTGSLIYYKSLALKAGALYHQKDTVQSAFLFSKVFEQAPSLRISCFTSYKWCNVTPKMIYPLCNNPREKAVVAALDGFGNPELSTVPIQNVYTLDPESPILNVLLAREINKLEETYLAPSLAKQGQDLQINTLDTRDISEQKELRNSLVALQSLADSLIAQKKLLNLNYWRMASAYLSYMQQDYAGAKLRLTAAKSKDSAEKDQWEMINLLVNINQQTDINKDFEAQLLTSFKWLDKKTGNIELPYDSYNTDQSWFYKKMYRNLLFAVLAPKYHKQGDYVKESLIRGRCDELMISDYFVSGKTAVEQIQDDMGPKELIKLNDFLLQQNKTPYETYLAKYFPKELNINATIGISYVRLHDFKSAAEWFKKAPAERLSISYQIFNDQLMDYGEDVETGKFNKPISQLDFCNQMVDLEETMKKPQAPATAFYKYANALFSISYYGHTWDFVKKYRPTYLWYTPEVEKDPFLRQYFGCYKAEEYYLKALKISSPTNKEFRARCAFLAARCAQKHIAIDNNDKYLKTWIRNKYFPQLVTDYSQTKFYQQVYNQCGYLRDYVKSNKK